MYMHVHVCSTLAYGTTGYCSNFHVASIQVYIYIIYMYIDMYHRV